MAKMKSILSPEETAYVRRFCYEVATNQFGPGSIFDYCQDHARDLEILATETGIQYDILEEVQAGQEPPLEVPFPWESFEDLHERGRELTLQESAS
jgi:hypothetical protein